MARARPATELRESKEAGKTLVAERPTNAKFTATHTGDGVTHIREATNRATPTDGAAERIGSLEVSRTVSTLVTADAHHVSLTETLP